MTYLISLEIATLLLHDDTRCAVCGMPNRLVKKLYRQGRGKNRQLTCDHINPAGGSERENLRPLCGPCNEKRQDAQLTDAELLDWAQHYWSFRFNHKARLLYWLNTHIDETGKAVGGTLFRSERAEQIERRVRGEEG